MDDETPGGHTGGSTRLEGRVIGGRYRVENVVASGANTIVTEAVDTDTDRPVTVKIVRPHRAASADFRAAFDRHIAIARSLAHPNVATVLDAGEVDVDGEPTCYWVVEYLGGGSLRDLFDRGRLLEPSQALVVGLEACRALEYAHARGVVHTEVTPAKLVFGVDGRLRIVDFSMAELIGAEAWSEPATVPTDVARYASPEQALAQPVGEKTDVYALSLCLIEAITGSVPFAGDSTVSTLAGRVGKLMPVTADMGSMAAVLERGGRPDAEDRWTATQFGRALVQAAESLARPEPIPVLASSLFATSLAARHAAAAGGQGASEAPAALGVDTDAPVAPSAADVPGATVPAGVDAGSNGAGAGDLVLVTDIADPPTGAVQVAGGGLDSSHTIEMPASVAAAAAVATTPDTQPKRPVDPTPYDAEREHRPWGKYLLLGLVILAGLAALGVAGYLLLRTKTYEVPDLVGVDQSVAINEVAGNDWDVQIERERSDEVREIDHVVRTDPPAGEQLAEGETFVMYVSDGPLLRTLPDFTGMPITEVRTQLEQMELGIAELAPVYSETVPLDAVVSWTVQGDPSLGVGAQVLPGTVIEVTTSLGPQPRPAPNLTNLTADEARAALEGIQLVYAQGEDVFSSDIEVGRVATQTPPPDTAVERGGTVTVQLSKGPELVAIPDLTGMTYPQAVQALEAAGFVVNSLLGTTDGTFVSISVNGDEVGAGETFPRGTGVDLIFL